MSDVTCSYCGRRMDQSDMCRHADRCDGDRAAGLWERAVQAEAERDALRAKVADAIDRWRNGAESGDMLVQIAMVLGEESRG
jgi:hypothetical protein